MGVLGLHVCNVHRQTELFSSENKKLDKAGQRNLPMWDSATCLPTCGLNPVVGKEICLCGTLLCVCPHMDLTL